MHDGIMRRGSVSSPGRSSRNPHVKTLSGATVYRPNTRRSPSASSPLANMAGLITRQDVDSLLLTFLLNETCLIVVVMLRGRLRLFGMFVLWFHLDSTLAWLPVRQIFRRVFQLFNAPQPEGHAHARHRRQQQDGIVCIGIEVLMFCHRGNADQVTLFPIPLLVVVDVVATPLDYEDLLLGHMPMLAGAAPRRNLLRVQPDSSGRAVHFRMGEPL